MIPLVEDGKRVAKGDVVAMVFRNDEEAANYLRVRELDSRSAIISSLQSTSRLPLISTP